MLKKLGLKLLALIIMINIAIPIFSDTTIPGQAWSRDINAGGYKDGAPIGGFGAGTVTWRFDGAFYKQRLNIGAGNDSGSDFVADTAAKFYMYQKPASGAASTRKLDAGTLGSGQAKYHSLFPKSWVDYYGSQFTIKSTVTQFSPIIPNDMTRTSYPVGIYEWDLTNPTAENVDVAIMLTWQSNDFSGANAQFSTAGNYRGIVLRSGITNPTNKNQGEFCLGTEAAAGTTVSYMSAAAIGTIETDFTTDGVLANTVGNNTIGAIAFKVTLAPGANVKIPIVLSWDIPIAQPTAGSKWYRKYTRHWSRTGQNSWAIAQDALANHDSYESQIDTWQNGVLTNAYYPEWLKTMLFNELYIYFVGGTIWEAGAASGQQDNANEDMFSHLESYAYKFYGTSDVRFYGSWALFLNWPDIDKQCVKQFSDSVSTARADRPAAIGTCAHDFGSPDTVFQQWNAYVYRDSTLWKDLNSKFVLMVYRDWLLTGSTDANFLNYCWNSVKVAMAKVKSQCAADSLPQSSGVDQTYDDMGLTGSTSYCGSLFLAACQAAKQIALAEGDNASATTYQSWFDLAQPNFESELWTGTYYKIDTGSTAPTRIMSDQLAGQWYSKTLGLGGIVTDAHAVSAWQKVYDNNFAKFDAGAHGVCNVMTAAGAIDNTSNQTAECWVGTSWGAVSGMVQQQMTAQAGAIGQSLYNTIWNTAQYWFRTPEAWQTGTSNPRAFYYMRGSTVWAAKRAYDLYPFTCGVNTCTPPPTPSFTYTPSPTATANPCATSYRRINCGNVAASYTDSLGKVWVQDQAYAAGGYGYVGGSGTEGNVAVNILNTTDDTLYQSGRYGGGLEYRFTVPNGSWRVVLKFAEIYTFTVPGQRVFNVSIEGTQVLTNFDIIASSGAQYTAIDRAFDVNVSDGIINIIFTNGTADVPKIDAIEILDLSTVCTPTVTITGTPPSPTNTFTRTPTRTITPYQSPTFTCTNTPYYSPTITRTHTISPTFTVTPVFTPLRVNCGGPQYTDGASNVWLADQSYTPGNWGYNSGAAATVANPIAGTTDDTLYQSEMYGNPSYIFDMPNGTYQVTLKFAETYWTAVGARVFNVMLEGNTVLTNLDIYAVAGANTAYDRVFTVTVSDGQLNLAMTAAADSGKIVAIQILQVVPTPTNTPSITRTSTFTPAMTFTNTQTRTTTNTYTFTNTPNWSPTFTNTINQSPTYTVTRTPTATYSRTSTATFTRTASVTLTPANTSTPTGTSTRTATQTGTLVNTLTATASASPVNSFTRTPTPTNTGSITRTFTPTLSGTPTFSVTLTATPSPTYTLTRTATPAFTFTATPSFTRTATGTATNTPSRTSTITPTFTRTPSFTATPSITLSCTGTPPSPTDTPTVTPSFTVTETGTASCTATATCTYTATPTSSPTRTRTSTPTLTFTATGTCTNTATLSASPTQTRTNTLTLTFTPSFTSTATRTASPAMTQTPSITATPSCTASATKTATPTATVYMTGTITETCSATPSITQTWTGTPPTWTFTPTITVTGTMSRVPSETITPSWTNTVTNTPVNTGTDTPVNTRTRTPIGSATPPVFTPTITFTPVIPPAPKTFQILDTSIYPNPYNPATGDLNARVNLTNAAQKFILRVYTVSFRKVMEEEENPGPYSSGTQTINVPAARFSRLASGTYYYRIEGESTAGGKAASAADKFVIIR